VLIKIYSDSAQLARNAVQKTEGFADAVVGASGSDIITSPVSSQFTATWEWFLLGGLFALLVYFLISRLKWFR